MYIYTTDLFPQSVESLQSKRISLMNSGAKVLRLHPAVESEISLLEVTQRGLEPPPGI